MPFYVVEQRGVPGKRLVEADKPASALNHVIADSFTCKKVDGRELLDAAKECVVEIAGGPKEEPEEQKTEPVYNNVDPEDRKVVEERDPDRLRDDLNDPARINPDDDE